MLVYACLYAYNEMLTCIFVTGDVWVLRPNLLVSLRNDISLLIIDSCFFSCSYISASMWEIIVRSKS